MSLCIHCRSEANWVSKPAGHERRVKSNPHSVTGVCDSCGYSGSVDTDSVLGGVDD